MACFLLQSFSGDIVRCWLSMPFIQVVSSRKDWHENNNELLKSSSSWISSIQWYRFLLNILSSMVLGIETSVQIWVQILTDVYCRTLKSCDYMRILNMYAALVNLWEFYEWIAIHISNMWSIIYTNKHQTVFLT